jgi:hypothetical protein
MVSISHHITKHDNCATNHFSAFTCHYEDEVHKRAYCIHILVPSLVRFLSLPLYPSGSTPCIFFYQFPSQGKYSQTPATHQGFSIQRATYTSEPNHILPFV